MFSITAQEKQFILNRRKTLSATEKVDEYFRKEANNAFNTFYRFITKNKEKVIRYDDLYGYLILADSISNWKHKDLNFAIVPTRRLNTDGKYDPAFDYKGKEIKIIILAILDADFDLTNVGIRVKQSKETFIHEFIHYLDFNRSNNKILRKGKINRSIEKYINSPAEFNAYYQEGATELLKHKKKIKLLSFNEFNKYALKFFHSSFIKNMNAVYKKKFYKRLYNLYNNVLS